MDETENEQLIHAAIYGAVVVAIGSAWYAFTTRKERAKRKKIQAWYKMNHSAVVAFETRLKSVLADPNATSDDFWKAWQEETAFMKLINDQPMY